MKRRTIEQPDTKATIDFLNPPGMRDANVTIERDGTTLKVNVKVLNPGYDTWEEKEFEMDLSKP